MKRTITVKIPFTVEIEILRETDAEELAARGEKINDEYGGWYWVANFFDPWQWQVDGYPDFCDTEKEAMESAKEKLKDIIMQELTR